MMDGGFHTPNHRWVIASALAQAARFSPDQDVRRTVNAYLTEGVDLDAEGFFIERSVGVYDAVNTRSLLLIAENYGWPAALDGSGRAQPHPRSAPAARGRYMGDQKFATAGLRHT